MKDTKHAKRAFIIIALLAVLFLVVFIALRLSARACDPRWEIKRHDALILASNRFAIFFVISFIVAATIGGALIKDYYDKRKSKVSDMKTNNFKISDNFKKTVYDDKASFFDAVWNEYTKIGAVEKFKEAYISQLEWLDIDEEIKEKDLTLTDAQKKVVKDEITNKISLIKKANMIMSLRKFSKKKLR